MAKVFTVSGHARRRMAVRAVVEADVLQTLRRPESIVRDMDDNEVRRRTIGARVVTIVIAKGSFPAHIITVCTE